MKSPLNHPSLLRTHVLNHLQQFMDEASLFPREGEQVLMGISGGVDSMVLGWALSQLLKAGQRPPPVWVHVNHGTRQQCLAEEKLVVRAASMAGCPSRVFHLDLKGRGNFEERAREARYRCFRRALEEFKGQVFYLGHTIDDSFEWHLLQQWRSAAHPAALGIPLVNGVFKRPLHCLSKKQIRRIARLLEISYLEDESNGDESLERNFIRRSLVSQISRRYPSYLKNYVARANQMAQERGQWALKRDAPPRLMKDALGGVCLLQWHGQGTFRGREGEIHKAFSLLSKKGRGETRRQVEKLMAAQERGKGGPMEMSGGVQVFMGPGTLLFLNSRQQQIYRRWDREMARCLLKGPADSQIPGEDNLWNPNHWNIPLSQLVAPFWVIGPALQWEGRPWPSLHHHPLFPHLLQACREKLLWVRPMGQVLPLYSRQKNRHPRDWGLVPLTPSRGMAMEMPSLGFWEGEY